MTGRQVLKFDSFERLPERYQDLLRDAGARNFFAGLGWFKNLAASAMEAGGALHIYGLEEEGRALAALVLRSPRSPQGSVLRGQELSAHALSSFTNFQTCEFAPAFAAGAGAPRELLTPIWRYVANERPSWDLIEVNSLPIDDACFDGMCAALTNAGFAVRRFPHFGNRYETFDTTSYEHYLKQRDTSDRKQFQNYQRKRRRLEKESALRVRIIAGAITDIEQVAADYEQIHAASWKDVEAFEDFLPSLLREAASHSRLRMGVLYLNGTPVATEVGLLHDNRATMIKTAYDSRYREHSVGAIVMMDVIKHLIEVDRVREIDFGRDDQAYKKLWVPQQRERWAVVACNPRTARGLLALGRILSVQARRSLVARVKQALRPVLLQVKARWKKSSSSSA